LRRLRGLLRARAPQLPVGAIAGINEENAAAVIGAGAEGIAVISAVIAVADAEAAARRLRALVDAARSKNASAA
jgi:thiamine-phosphate pyrophosphorylase